MKYFHREALVLSLALASACQVVVDSSIQLQDEFVSSADEFRLEPPSWRFSNKHYEADLGAYRAAHVKKPGWTRQKKRTLLSTETDDYTLFNFLFRGRIQPERYSTKKYEISRVRDFSYAIVNTTGTIKVSSTCKAADLFEQEVIKKKFYLGKKGKETSREGERDEDWISTALSCELLQNNRSWRLNLVSVNDQSAQITVDSEGMTLTFEEITGLERVLQDNSGKKTTYQNDSAKSQEYLGASIMLGGNQIGAVSFTYPNHKIWIEKQLPAELREVLLGVGYGLILFDWLSDDWRQQ